ncbi:MAG: hypothetical protein JWL86_637 [Rhizobium sp.]|nr:hypothetical protein [Rhizobium sp.]
MTAPRICADCKHSVAHEYRVWFEGRGHLWWRQPGCWSQRSEMHCAASREIDTGLPNFRMHCIRERSSMLGCGPSGCLFEAKDVRADVGSAA